ncbi:MAG: hypothetical protein U9Q15_04010 [Patescibacteria group bacterium]|nr:hypothetical protein [Patescibacteria group bacterium]
MSGVLVGAASFENFTLNHPYFSGSIVSGVAKGTFVGTYSTGSHPVSGDK